MTLKEGIAFLENVTNMLDNRKHSAILCEAFAPFLENPQNSTSNIPETASESEKLR